jgi:phage terminase small subunit
MADMTHKQRLFVAEYLQDLNATAAAIRAGYSERTARQQGARLLTNADIVEAIRQEVQQRLKGAGVTAQRVMAELQKVAYGDMGDYLVFQENGQLRLDFSKARGRTAAIASIDQDVQMTGRRTPPALTTKVRLWYKVRALGELSRMIEMTKQGNQSGQAGEETGPAAMTPAEARRRWADGIEEAATHYETDWVDELVAKMREGALAAGAAANGSDRADG